MADFRVSYAKEADLLAYAKTIGWVDEKGRIVAIGGFLTPAAASSDGCIPAPGSDGPHDQGRLRQRHGRNDRRRAQLAHAADQRNNPFAGDSPLPLPTNGVTVWPPVMEGNPDYVQPVVAVIA